MEGEGRKRGRGIGFAILQGRSRGEATLVQLSLITIDWLI